jgi:hypothetical protein
MQLSHLLLAFGCTSFLFHHGVRLGLAEFILFSLATYCLLVEWVAGTSYEFVDTVLPACYVFFSLLIFSSLRRWAPRGAVYFKAGLFLALLVALCGVLALGYGLTTDSEGGRAVGTFNNPNQLGYFSVCLASLAGLLFLQRSLSSGRFLLVLCAVAFLAVASLSKAAMISVGFLSLVSVLALTRSRGALAISVTSGVVVVLLSIFLVRSGALDGFAFFHRLSEIGQQDDDSFAERGYAIFLQGDLLQLVFGFGSDTVKKFVGHEVHSTVASFFAGYGLVGGGLFIWFLGLWVAKIYRGLGSIGVAMVAVPPLLYGISHNGSRFAVFWVLVAASWGAVEVLNQGESRMAPGARTN